MPEQRHLRNAPITEALIDFRVKARSDFEPKEFAALIEPLKSRFPTAQEQRTGQLNIKLSPKGATQEVEFLGPQGYFFSSADGKLIAQFRVDGFTLNRLKPYTSWEEFFPQAMDLWSRYGPIARPLTVTRIALRYLNHIVLPVGSFVTTDVLSASPRIPDELPQYVNGFISQIMTSTPGDPAAVHIVQALEPEPVTRTPIITLDIDAFQETDLAWDDGVITDILLRLRQLKNQVFFSHLTERILKTFE